MQANIQAADPPKPTQTDHSAVLGGPELSQNSPEIPQAEPPTAHEAAQNPPKSGGKWGAPEGNRNRMTHGVRGWLVIGSLPKGASWVRRVVGEFRRQIESGVLAIHGEITPYASALCQSATRHEGRALLASRWLKHEPDLPLSERLSLLKTIGDATDARDKCLKLIGLDRLPQERNPWDALHDAHHAAVDDADSRPANHPQTEMEAHHETQ